MLFLILGSAIEALNVLVGQHGVPPSKIIFANMICAPEGLKILADTYPEVKIVTAVIDKNLNDEKFIVPGLGTYYYISTILVGTTKKRTSIRTNTKDQLGVFVIVHLIKYVRLAAYYFNALFFLLTLYDR